MTKPDSEYNNTEEREIEKEYKTVQVFTLKEAHEEVEWKVNYTSKPISDAEEQSSQAPTVKIESDSAEDNEVGTPFRNKLETLLESQEVTNQNTKYGTCGTMSNGVGIKEVK